MARPDSDPTQTSPTEDTPELFSIVHVEFPIKLCSVEHWVEDGMHVVRAEDFELIAMADSVEDAIALFVEDAYSLWNALGELVRRDEATERERELFHRLAGPIIDAFRREREAEARRRARFIDFPRLRRRGDHSRGDWRTASSHATFNQPSIA